MYWVGWLVGRWMSEVGEISISAAAADETLLCLLCNF